MTEHVRTDFGDTVAFDRHGTAPGSGPAVVFVSGAGPYRAIDPVTTQTAELVAQGGFPALVYDRLGRGESPAEGDLSLDRELAALRALIDAAGGSAVLCGHSSGCAISLAAAAAGLPVSGLVLWEAPLARDSAATKAWIEEFERRLAAGDLESALLHYMKDMPPEWLEAARNDPAFPLAVEAVGSYRADGEALVWADQPPYPERFADVRVPIAAVVGTETFPGMREAASAIAEGIPGATSGTAPGAHHAWEPGPMSELIIAFVQDRIKT